MEEDGNIKREKTGEEGEHSITRKSMTQSRIGEEDSEVDEREDSVTKIWIFPG